MGSIWNAILTDTSRNRESESDTSMLLPITWRSRPGKPIVSVDYTRICHDLYGKKK